jgi:tyrosyl-tRNA synthetase
MTAEERFALVTRHAAEVVTPDELRTLLEGEPAPRVYVGFEPSGFLHVGLGVITAEKLKDFHAAGFDVTVLLADWHAYINDKLGGDMDRIHACAAYFRDAFLALGVPPETKFVYARDLVASSTYWMNVLRTAKAATLARLRRALTIMGRREDEAEQDASKLIYPVMQVTDIHALDLDVAYGGMDQRHAHMLYRDLSPKLGWKQVVAVHTPLLPGLKGGGRMETWDAKMSKSDPRHAILVHDEPETIAGKVEGAFCPPRETEGNFVTELCRLILFPYAGPLRVERDGKHGGDVTYASYADLEGAYRAGQLHPQDLKRAAAAALAAYLRPVRESFARRPHNLERLQEILGDR